MSCMSGSPNLNSFRDRGQVAVQLVSCGVLLPGLQVWVDLGVMETKKWLHTPQSNRTIVSPPDSLLKYPGHIFGFGEVLTPLQEIQLAYSKPPQRESRYGLILSMDFIINGWRVWEFIYQIKRRNHCTEKHLLVRHEFKSWTWLIAFHIASIPLGKVWIQLWVNSRADWVLQSWRGN